MERFVAWIRRIYSKHWQEGVVLIAIIVLDRLGWLPRIITDAGDTYSETASAALTRGACLLVGLTVLWAVVDQFFSDHQKDEDREVGARRSA